MKHAPSGREEGKTARDWDPKSIHEETQCDETAETKQREEWVHQFQNVPLSENVDETQKSRKLRRMHAWSNPKIPAEQQWNTETQTPEHHEAYLEQATCLR